MSLGKVLLLLGQKPWNVCLRLWLWTPAYWQGYVMIWFLSVEDFEVAMPRLHSNFSLILSAFHVFLKSIFHFSVWMQLLWSCFYQLLLILQSDMQRGVHGRLMDNSTSVREAAVELLGRFVLSRPQLTEQYYDMLIERILVRFHHTSFEKFVRLYHKCILIYMFQEKFLLLNSPFCWRKGKCVFWNDIYEIILQENPKSCGVIQGSVSQVVHEIINGPCKCNCGH